MTGMFLVRRNSESLRLLRDWWAHAGGPWAKCGPFDQGYFCQDLTPLHWGRIRLIAEEASEDIPGQYIHHRCGMCDWLPDQLEMVTRIMNQTDGPSTAELDKVARYFADGFGQGPLRPLV